MKNNDDSKHSEHVSIEIIKDIVDEFFKQLLNIVPTKPIDSYIDECKNELENLITDDNIDIFYEMITNSGKGISENGLERECVNRFSYIKIIYNKNFSSQNNEVSNITAFLEQTSFYTGLCLNHKCQKALINLIDNNSSYSELFKYLKEEYQIDKVSYLQTSRGIDDNDNGIQYLIFRILIYTIVGYSLLKIIATLIKIAFYSSYDIQQKDNKDINQKGISNEVEVNKNNDKENDNSVNQDNQLLLENPKMKQEENNFTLFNNTLTQSSLSSAQSHNSYFYRVIKFFDILSNIRLLSSFKNKYYNDQYISLLTFLRVILMFVLVYNHNVYTITKIPGRDFLNIEFYQHWLFFIIKFTTYTASLWVVIDGAVFAYKFISSIKNEMKRTGYNSISFIFIMKWWLLSLPKIVIFFFVFYFAHVFMKYYAESEYYSDSTMFQYYLKNFQNRQCMKEPHKLFIPFFVAYFDNLKPFIYCHRFVYISLNEFYCFIVLTLYFYLAMKIKSKIIDYCLLVLTIGNIIGTYWSSNISYEQYIFSDVLGNGQSEKYTHLFINYYLLGVFIGMSNFYYYDAISKDSLSNTDTYVPFGFCFTLIKALDTLKNAWKKVLLCFFIILWLLASFSYTIIRLVKRTPYNFLSFPVDIYINIIDIYEKYIIAIIFTFIALLLLVYPKDTTLKYVISSNIFIPFGRLSFPFFCLSNAIIYISYCIFIIQLKLSYTNLFYISIGFLLILSFLSVIINIMFELPFRVWIKKLFRLNSNSNDISDIDYIKQNISHNMMPFDE